MLADSETHQIETPRILKGFHSQAGPLYLAVVLFCLSQASQFDPLHDQGMSLWYCGAVTAQVLLFLPQHRHWQFHLWAWIALFTSNLLMPQPIALALWISGIQAIEPIIGLMIVQFALNSTLADRLTIQPGLKRIVIGCVLSGLWIHFWAFIGAAGLSTIAGVDLLETAARWGVIAMVAGASYMPIGLGLCFAQHSAKPISRGMIALGMVPLTGMLMTYVEPAPLVLALAYPIVLSLVGVAWAGAYWAASIVMWFGLNQNELLGPFGVQQGIVLMMTSTVCLLSTLIHLQRKRANQLLAASAYTDPITGLINRRGFESISVERAWDFVVLIELDEYRELSEQKGQAACDRLAVAATKALKHFTDGDTQLARLDADRFVFFGTAGSRIIGDWSESIRRHLDRATAIDDTPLTGTLGCSHAPVEINVLLSQADMALVKARRLGRNQVQQYDGHADLDPREITAQRIRQALARDEMAYAVQPIYDTAGEHRIGYEALIRWRLHDHWLTPNHFLGTLLEIGRERFVQRALLQLQSKLALSLGPGAGVLSFNWGIDDLTDRVWVDEWLAHWEPISGRTPVLMIEISESAGESQDESPVLASSIARLRQAGFQIALDDFGKENSNLSRLVGWEIDRVKLDKSLVDGLSQPNSSAEIIIRTLKKLADELGLSLVAEGVESEVQNHRLKQLGIHLHQGHLWGKPQVR